MSLVWPVRPGPPKPLPQSPLISATRTTGQVTLPLEEYQRLLQQATTQPLSAPSSYAVGQSVLNVVFHQRDGHVTATVQAQVEVETFEDEWTLVALLSPGSRTGIRPHQWCSRYNWCSAPRACSGWLKNARKPLCS